MAEDVQEQIILESTLMWATTINGSWIGCSNQIVEIVHNIFFILLFFVFPNLALFCVWIYKVFFF